jgi:hypothetical protein
MAQGISGRRMTSKFEEAVLQKRALDTLAEM